jgi:hypothetical protein
MADDSAEDLEQNLFQAPNSVDDNSCSDFGSDDEDALSSDHSTRTLSNIREDIKVRIIEMYSTLVSYIVFSQSLC